MLHWELELTILRVLILTRENCNFCQTAETMLARLSREYPITISTLPLESAAGHTLAQSGRIPFPPGIFIDGEPCCYGRLSEARLRTEIERRL